MCIFVQASRVAVLVDLVGLVEVCPSLSLVVYLFRSAILCWLCAHKSENRNNLPLRAYALLYFLGQRERERVSICKSALTYTTYDIIIEI